MRGVSEGGKGEGGGVRASGPNEVSLGRRITPVQNDVVVDANHPVAAAR